MSFVFRLVGLWVLCLVLMAVGSTDTQARPRLLSRLIHRCQPAQVEVPVKGCDCEKCPCPKGCKDCPKGCSKDCPCQKKPKACEGCCPNCPRK